MVSSEQTPSEPVVATLIQRVAEAKDKDPRELPPLYNAIDPDAVEALVESFTTRSASITFTFHDVTVKVTGDKDVTIVSSSD